MNKLWLLLKIQLLDFFNFNKARGSKGKKQSKKTIAFSIMLLFVATLCFGYSFMYSFMMAEALAPLGLMHLLLAMMMMATCIVILITTISKTSSILFGFKDYDTIMSLPIKTRVVISSRIVMLYILNIFFTLLIMLPAGIVYAIKMQPSSLYYILFIITLLFVPLVPIIIATFIGTIITMVSTHFKRSNMVSTVLGLVFFVAIMAVSFNANKFTDNFTDIGQMIVSKVNKIYPLAQLYTEAVCDYNNVSLLVFIGVSAALFIAYIYIVAIKYKQINTAVTTNRTISNYKMESLVESSPFMSLYKKEISRYLSSTLYVINTALGILMLFLATGLMLFSSDAKQMLETPEISSIIDKVIPLVVSGFMTMSCTTSASISLEGKSLWILKSTPINTKTIFLSKIAVNLTLLIPSAIICSIIFAFKLQTNIIETILLLVTPMVYAVFISLLGIVVNLKFPKLNWTAEAAVIKQSMSVFIAMLVGFFSILIPIIIVFLLSSFIDMSLLIGIITFAIAIITVLMYKYINTKGVKIFNRL